MVESTMFPGGYYQNAFEAPGESEGSGSSRQIDTEVTASENSSVPKRKCIRLNSTKEDPYGVPRQVISLHNMSQSERKDLIHRLKHELEQTKIVLKKAVLQRLDTAAFSSTSDMVVSSTMLKATQVSSFRKSAKYGMGSVRKVQPQSSGLRGWNRGSSGKFEPAKQSLTSTSTEALMKQCETVLKNLFSHPRAWPFKDPVDVVRLNIPDYFTIIKHPMDLGTVRKNLSSGVYSSPLEFAADVRLIFTNAMTYNPPGHDVYIMADMLSKLFESRWRTIEKKLPAVESQPLLTTIPKPHEDRKVAKSLPPAKKQKTSSYAKERVVESVKHAMTDEERHKLGRQLESLLDEVPTHIIDFLKKHSSDGAEAGEDEIEIDIDVLSDEVLLTLRKLLDEYLIEKERKKQPTTEPCEIELLNGSGPSNSSVQQGNDLADEYVGGNEPPMSGSFSDSGSSSSEDGSDDAKAMNQENVLQIPETETSEAQREEKTRTDDAERSQSRCMMDHLDSSSQQKPSSDDSERHHGGNILERQVPSEKLYRAALLKNRFADIILKAREKTIPQNDVKGDPERLRKEREELELQKKKERARLQAEAKAAEDARRQAEAAAAIEAKRKRELEREAARQALLKMEKTVEINENSRFLEDLEMLSSGPPEHLPSSADETSPERPLDNLSSFMLSGSNPLEQLGLFMKRDDDEDETEPFAALPSQANDVEEDEAEPFAALPSQANDVEEGEID